ncbi:MAG: carboxypeptidase-like regulatory domain-containing protein, partial [Deltaproteobacteria bacterium]|nr:carboxypeptidase-like regulatory domain-containing protein [Deltaproteobacteria bacterium]
MKTLRAGWFFGSLLLLLVVGGCDSEVNVRDNPFDPEGSTPAPATVRGGVNAIGRPTLPGRASNEDILVRIFLEEDAPATGTDGGEAPASERTARTDAEGIFLFPDVVPGTYRLELSEPGFLPVRLRSIAVPLAANVDLGTIDLMPTVETSPSAVMGTVLLEGLDPAGTLHGGISVRTIGWPFDVLTAPDGTFNLPISDGTFDFEISFPNYETQTIAGVVIGISETITLDGDPATPEADPIVLLSNPGAITGVVEREVCAATPPVTYEPGDGVNVSAGIGATPLYSAAADPTGAFVLSGMTAGIYRVDLSLAGWEPVRLAGNQVAAGQITDLGTVQLAASRGAIVGRILLSGSTDHSGILVQVNGTNFVTLTAADGSFRIPGVCAGTGYEIVASRDGYVTTSISGLAVTAGQDTRVTDAAGNDPVLERQQGGLTLNSGFPYVNTLDVGYQLDAPAGTTHMRMSEDPSVFSTQGDPANPDPATNGGWVAYSVTGTFTLAASEGTRNVTAQVYGNGAFSGLIQGTVVLDQTAPLQPTIVVEDGSGFSNDLDGSVLVTLTASEAPAPGVDITSGLASVKFVDLDPAACGTPPCPPAQTDWDAATALPYNRTLDHPLLDPLLDGAKEIWVTFSDRAGNWSAPV